MGLAGGCLCTICRPPGEPLWLPVLLCIPPHPRHAVALLSTSVLWLVSTGLTRSPHKHGFCNGTGWLCSLCVCGLHPEPTWGSCSPGRYSRNPPESLGKERVHAPRCHCTATFPLSPGSADPTWLSLLSSIGVGRGWAHGSGAWHCREQLQFIHGDGVWDPQGLGEPQPGTGASPGHKHPPASPEGPMSSSIGAGSLKLKGWENPRM